MLLMKESIYQLALRCKSISDDKMGTDKTLIPYRNLMFTDYTVKGPVGDYLNAIDDLCSALADKYPAIGYELRLHKDSYREEKIVHFTAMKTIVDCVLALEKENHAKRYYILPDVNFKEIGWLCDAYKADKLADSVALDTLEQELTDFYGLPRKGGIWSRQRIAICNCRRIN